MPADTHPIVTVAKTWLGTCYHHQGRLKKLASSNGGVDCFGLVMGVARELSLKSKTGRLMAEFDQIDYSPYPNGVRLKEFLDTHLIHVSKHDAIPGDVL